MFHQLFSRAYRRAITARLNGSEPDVAVPRGGKTEQLMLMTLFSVMGRLAKLDGRVMPSEIRYATTIINLLGLGDEARQHAIHYFDHGKTASDAQVISYVTLLSRAVGRRSALAQLFLKVQIRATLVKGDMRLQEKVLLRDVADELGYEKGEFLALCGEMQRTVDKALESKGIKARSFLQNAYQILQLKPDVADGEIKRAYLRLMSRYHPDKLVRDNLPEDDLKQAQEKSMAIRSAYETICGFRKIRA